AMADITPLKQTTHAEQYMRRPPPRPIKQPDYIRAESCVTSAIKPSIPTSNPEGYLEFCRPGVRDKVFRNLRGGKIQPELRLDLHGLTVVYAEEQLELFLQVCRKRQLRCVCIIHGKGMRSLGGQPILKSRVDQWLRCRDDIIAFASAPHWDGGTGAVYVLLSNPSKFRK
ncbi:hypothetical protein TI04_11725, partial [Achromatium sp. WMS2]